MDTLFDSLEKASQGRGPMLDSTENLIKGDMPGDKVNVCREQIDKINTIFPTLSTHLLKALKNNHHQKAVAAISGGSGVGKSGIASLLATYLKNLGVGCYLLSGDNYPHRIPSQNDAERLRVFRHGGLRGLVAGGLYSENVRSQLLELQLAEEDSAPKLCSDYPWLETYQLEGKKALAGYLGTEKEQDFCELNRIVAEFKNGADSIWLKRMGREERDLWYENVSMQDAHVLIIEWTHGNSDGYLGVDVPVFLNSTPEETLAYRRSRNRDGAVDSHFTTMVLEIEQRLLESQVHKAKIILSKSGEILSYNEYRQLMAKG